jgi:pyridoxamine 5'-phosphate oxidase
MSQDQTTQHESDFAAAAEPFLLFEGWFAEAHKSEINDPNGMALATADASGLPNVRMVLLKGLDGAGTPSRGFVFYTNLESAKGRELLANPQAAILFHWKSLRRQVRARGAITPVSPEEADEYFASRHRTSRIGAWASKQSRPLESRLALEKAVAIETARFGIAEVPRPPHWSGFRLTPIEMEFWSDRPFRLHDRLVFRRKSTDDNWTKERLYP